MTLYLIAERIFRIYQGGIPSIDTGIKIADIRHMVVDQINALLKVETLSLNKQLGDNAPTGLMLATYSDIDVTISADGVQSQALLPAMPISLPKNMGVWYVAADDANIHDQFVPLDSGQFSLIKDFDPLVSNGKILGNYIYYIDGKNIMFPTNIFSAVHKIMVRLVISDISLLGDFDLLPMPQDYADQVIKNVLSILGVVSKVEDVTNDSNKQK